VLEETIKVSIIITCYNYKDYIGQAIESVMNQRFERRHFELIIVDDGSSDGSESIIDSYSDFARIYHLKNQGLEKAANFGISKAKGKYITRLDADDFLRGDYLKVLVPLLEQDDEMAFAYSDYYELRNETETRVKLPLFNVDEIKKRGDFLATGTMYRKKIFDVAGGYSEAVCNCGLENYELILKMILKFNMTGCHVGVPLFNYRVHGDNMSLCRRQGIIKYGNKICRQLGLSEYNVNEFNPVCSCN